MEKGEGSKKRRGDDGDEDQEQEQELALALAELPPSPSLQPLLQQVAEGASFDWTPVFDRVIHSLVFVLIEPKPERLKDISAVAKRVKTVRGKENRRRAVRRGYTSTGFVYKNGPVGLLIMTSAHGLRHLFKGSDPLTTTTLHMFNVSVLCDHQEHEFQHAGAIGNRKYGNASLVACDSSTGTLLVGVMYTELKNFFDDGVCSQGHPALEIAESIPREVKPCMLISWPSHRPRTVAVGWSSSPRAVDAIFWPNRTQYNMTLLEVYMTTEEGSLGAPLIDTKGEVIGMLHWGFGEAHSCFVAANHLYCWRNQFTRALHV